MFSIRFLLSTIVCAFLSMVAGQSQTSAGPPNTYPKVYPGMPTTGYGPKWQKYFQVTDPLPNVTLAMDLGRNWAGNIGVNRTHHSNDTLFFWGFEHSPGSLTDVNNDKPWGIWLNGGPGSSSMIGLLFENGPLRINSDYSMSANPHGWSQLVDYFWVDNPVGTGFSTADTNGYALNSQQMAQDFLGFLSNLVKIFPGLAKRPLYLTGESYAGVYIPYITKAYFAMQDPPFKLAGIAIGDGSMNGVDGDVAIDLPTVSLIETYPQLIGYSSQAYSFFKSQSHFCGFDLNLTYPQTGGHFPTIDIPLGQYQLGMDQLQRRSSSKQVQRAKLAAILKRSEGVVEKRSERARLIARKTRASQWLSEQNPNAMNPWYGCDINTMLNDYAVNYTAPFKTANFLNMYDVPDSTHNIFIDAAVFLNDPRTRKALHAPSHNWVPSQEFAFGVNTYIDSSVQPMAFFDQLASDATKHKVKVVIISGNDDFLLPHRGSEVVIQNTTFGGVQGFWRKPSTAWKDMDGNFGGIVHQERGWTYVLAVNAGHLLPNSNPVAAYTILRDFIVGTVTTGLVTSPNVIAIGGENVSLSGDYYRGQDGIAYLDSAGKTKTHVAPKATISAWNAFMIEVSATPTGKPRASTPLQSTATSTSTRQHQC